MLNFWKDGKKWGIEVSGGVNFEILHRGGIGEGNTLITAKNDDRGAFGAFAHQKYCHAGEWIDEIDLGDVHGATKKVWLATDILQRFDTSETDSDTSNAPAQRSSVGIGGDDTEIFKMMAMNQARTNFPTESIGIFGPHNIVAVGVRFVDTGGGNEDILSNSKVNIKAAFKVIWEIVSGFLPNKFFFSDSANLCGATLMETENLRSDENDISFSYV